ncbi:hypothetical protein [Actinomadura harenae]|uniref:Uncharacterized protein n=1 Tax=Actinomadura harenae TaxID=2483351 RepID=A0A3M2M3F9_9ACTN|nr:hypothetical protein [Actinomadura harenae]RMI43650.1 hypothetical protein EBO15_15555 [Actinomadura harenae]
MGLRARLLRYAAGRPRPLVVAVPGFTGVRLAVEADLRRRGWRPALAPAEADLLIVCGRPGPDLARAIDTVWDQMPSPRARADAPTASDVPSALDAASAHLADEPAQLEDAAQRASYTPETSMDHSTMDHGDMDHGDMDHSAMGHGDMDHGAMGHEGHESMDHEAMGHESMGHEAMGHEGHGGHGGHGGGHDHHMMGAPHGLAMADRAPDRDGLKLDVLHVPFGPVLADWPAGLKVTFTLQGDVVQAAEVEHLAGDAGAGRFWDGTNVVAARLDALARLLAVAGWTGQAAQARVLRDQALDGKVEKARLEKFVRRTRRSRTLRWMLQDVGLGETNAWTRASGWLAEIGGETRPDTSAATPPLGELLVGLDVAAARLLVAALDPDTEGAVAEHV